MSSSIKRVRRPTQQMLARRALTLHGYAPQAVRETLYIKVGQKTVAVKPHLYLTDKGVFVFAVKFDPERTKFKQDRGLQAVYTCVKQRVELLRRQGIGCIFLDGKMMRELESTDANIATPARERLVALIATQKRVTSKTLRELRVREKRDAKQHDRKERARGRRNVASKASPASRPASGTQLLTGRQRRMQRIVHREGAEMVAA